MKVNKLLMDTQRLYQNSKIKDVRNPIVSDILGNAVIISFVYSFSKNLKATGATNIKQNAAPRKK